MSPRRLFCLLLALLVLALPALAQTLQVEDLAEALPLAFTEDFSNFSRLHEEALGLHFYVVTKHFLGGKQAQAYADQLLSEQLDARTILLVLIIGEERYALATGSEAAQLLSGEKAESLLAAHLRSPFLDERDYARAVAAFFLNLSAFLQSQTGIQVATGDLLRTYAGLSSGSPHPATPFPTSGPSWLDAILEDRQIIEDEVWEYDSDVRHANEGHGSRLSLFQIALIGFVLYKIFGRKNQNGRRGCGPLGWIFGAWGLSRFFGRRR